MPKSITIPSTIDEAREALDGLGSLITARKWERAAIVAAFVRVSPGRGQVHPDIAGRGNRAFPISPTEFAEFGIVGLLTDKSVTKYVQAWLDAHDGNYPRPGATRRLPTSGFPPMRTGTDGHNSDDGLTTTVDRMVDRHGPAAVRDAVVRATSSGSLGIDHDNPPRETADDRDTRRADAAERVLDAESAESLATIEALAAIARLHDDVSNAARLIARLSNRGANTEVWRRCAEVHEQVGLLRDLARGMTSEDMDALLGGER